MSEEVVIALIGFVGSILGAAIAGFAAIAAAEIKGREKRSISCGVVGLLASLGAAGGLVLGALFGTSLMRNKASQLFTQPTLISSATRTSPFVVVIATPHSALATQVSPSTAIQVLQTPVLQPTSTPPLEFVYREATGGYVTQKYDIVLGPGEVISGQGYGFQQHEGGCIAFLIKGPGRFAFSVTDGEWLYYRNVSSSEQAELLLQNQIDSLVRQGCAPSKVKVFRMP